MNSNVRGPYLNREAEYNEARRLRREMGYGYGLIAAEIGVPASTVANWVSDIPTDKNVASAIALKRKKLTPIPLEKLKHKDAIRRRYIADRGHACQCCGLSTWRGQPIYLEMHRRGGSDSPYNCPENVELLCLNCHAQTEGYRNSKPSNKPMPPAGVEPASH